MFAKILISSRPRIASLKNLKSNFSSFSADFSQIEVPKEIASEFKNIIDLRYKSFKSEDFSLKEFGEKEGEFWCSELKKITASNQEFLDKLNKVKENKTFATVLKGIKLDEIILEEAPKQKSDLDNNNLKKKLRSAEISIIAYSNLLEIKSNDYLQGHYTGFVFATENYRHQKGSFQSSNTNLGWHNDGYSSGNTMPFVVLLGVLGNNKAETQMISYGRIVDYFTKNNKENLLNILNEFCEVEGANEFILEKIKIIDKENKNINYADYGSFYPKSNFKEFIDAINFLNDALENIEPSRVIINNGDLIALDNKKGLHRRVLTNNNQENDGDLVGQRLLTRILGTKNDDKSR